MESDHLTSSFGRRPLSLAMVAAQMGIKTSRLAGPVHKWKTFRLLTECKERYGLSDRTLSVLNALLTCLPETALCGSKGLVVFPSNKQLSLRSHGMSEPTLRRHLNALVQVGLIIRKDSPNGKRYARRNLSGDVEVAFGFDLAPFVSKATEIEHVAHELRDERRLAAMARERITILRRDLAKMIDLVMLECPCETSRACQHEYLQLSDRLPRVVTPEMLHPLELKLRRLAGDVELLLTTHIPSQDMSGNDMHCDVQYQNSNTDLVFESEKRTGDKRPEERTPSLVSKFNLPIQTILKACPDITDYSKTGIRNFNDLVSAAHLVRSILGISPSAWDAARDTMGDLNAAIVIAAMLQSAEKIRSPGGYLRVLTSKAMAAGFSPTPMIMALLRPQNLN
jgi:replication initiation protein RepC